MKERLVSMFRIFLTLSLGAIMPLLMLAQAPFQITHQPYLQALDETSVSILWTTNKTAISWVELAPDDGSHFYQKERPKYFAVRHGFKVKDTLHHVRLEGLQPGTTYRYRVFSQEVKSHEWVTVEYGRVAATQVYRKEPLSFTTVDPAATTISFAMINDIHGNNELMKKLLGQIEFAENDLVFFNGDMASHFLGEGQVFGSFMDTATHVFASTHPMYYARGNHETRGPFAERFADYFPTKSGQLYYLLRRGPICFVVLDAGEDKPDADMEYSGIVAFDEYRTQQAEWLEAAMKRPEYTEAPFKVVICHMPPFGGWHGEVEVAEKFVPLLNEAGAHLMLSGHLHRHINRQPDPEGHRFPVLINANTSVVKATADSKHLHIEVIDQDGKVIENITINSSAKR
ncbi:metallophosphoesterase [Parapedobacter sp. GCM10030251]|uniref:metallophosphoesterase n=1 Tax=Parapedobacter sp. GCM10030251 TaxID=3273419 RepID=UPI003607BA22